MYLFFFILLFSFIIFVTLFFVIKRKNSKSKNHDFVLVNEYIPNIIIDLRYYSDYNFVGERINGYLEPCAILTKDAAIALKKVNDELNSKGYLIKIYDAYRPKDAVKHFIKWSKNINDTRMKKDFYPELDKAVLFKKGYISKKSSHSRGSTLDLTLVDMSTLKEIDMGGSFDYFGTLSHFNYSGLNKNQFRNRMILRDVMVSNGFKPLDEEWWHFTLSNEPFPTTYFNFSIEKNSIK